MAETPLCSVVVPTRDRPELLRSCLDGLAALDYPRERLQVIVVNDGGSATAAGEGADDLLVTGGIGPAGARNAGVERAEGELLAFIDDDCYPRADWLDRLVSRWEQERVAAVGGQTVNALPDSLCAEAAQLVIDVGYVQNSAPDRRWFTTNNLLVPTAGFRDLGGFDAAYRTAEDRDFCARWLDSGRPMSYEPTAVVGHSRRMGLTEFAAMHFAYGRGAFRFHRDRRRLGAPVAVEPSYYVALARAAFDRDSPGRAAALEGLLLVWHATNTAGFLYEWGRSLRDGTP
jgi:GT2 family glycosyltransferase